MKRKFCIDNQWEQRVRNYSYCRTAHAFKIVRRLWPKESPLYAIVSKELRRKANHVFCDVAREYFPLLYRYDFVATCMMKLTRQIEEVPSANFYTWLVDMAENQAADHCGRWSQGPAGMLSASIHKARDRAADRAHLEGPTTLTDHAEDRAVRAQFLRAVEDKFGSLTRGVVEMNMTGVAHEYIADYYGLEPLGVGVILKEVQDFCTQHRNCLA